MSGSGCCASGRPLECRQWAWAVRGFGIILRGVKVEEEMGTPRPEHSVG